MTRKTATRNFSEKDFVVVPKVPDKPRERRKKKEPPET